MPRGRPKKTIEEGNAAVSLEDDEGEVSKPSPAGIDVSELVNSVRGRYKKDKQGLASDLVTGSEITLSNRDEDYISTPDIRKYWGPLTGIKGSPYGRIIQIAGLPDSGKSTLAMLFMAAAQASGALVILWDSEKKFSIARYDNKMGGNSEAIVSTRNKNIIEGAKQVAWYVKAAKEQNPNAKILVVWDSVGATMNSAEDDDENDDYSKQPGVTAREVSWAIKKLNKLIERYRNTKTGEETVSVICVNQTYANIGSVGQKEKGGQELTYLSSIILQLTRKSDLTRVRQKQKMKYGIVTRAKVKKNHLFDGEECVAELNLVVSADGIKLENEVKGIDGIAGWDDEEYTDA